MSRDSRTSGIDDMVMPDIGDIKPGHIKNRNFDKFFKSMRLKVEKFTQEWNRDETNRDKTVQVLK